METNKLVNTDNRILSIVLDANGTDKGYASFKSFYGAVIKNLEDMGCDEYIDEGSYFLALNELNILHRGIMKNKLFIRTDSKDNKWYPPEQNLYIALNDFIKKKKENKESASEFITSEIYFWKRGTWGFNIKNDDFEIKILNPVIKILCELNKELDTKITEKYETAKILLEASGIPLSILNTKTYKQQIINKFFQNKMKDK